MVFLFLLVDHVVRVCQEDVVWQIRVQRRSVQVKENGVHERRLRRMVLTSSGQQNEQRKSKSAFVQWSLGSPA